MRPSAGIISIVIFFLIGTKISLSQPVLKPELTDGSDFRKIQHDLNSFYEANPTFKGYKQWKRKEWFLEPRLYPEGKMENLTLKTWHAYDHYMQTVADTRSTHGSWSFLGPTQCATGLGRLNTVAIDPTNSAVIYVGSSNGGIWKSTNGGITWSNVSPVIPLLSIADIKLSPSDPDVVFILTGDGDPDPDETASHQQTEVTSIGILKSSDGGSTWYPTNFSFDHPSAIVPTKMLIHPTNVNIQFVVNATGILRTENQWSTWEVVSPGLFYDIEFKPGNPNTMYASTDTHIFRSENNGETWLPVYDIDLSDLYDATRIELAVAPNNANVVYALAGNWFGGFVGFYLSEDSGENNTWTLQNSSASTLGKYTNYCIALVVDPTDWTDVFGGMQWINKSTNEGTTWVSIVGTVHADIHDAAYTEGALWICCDGGLYKSTNEGTTWIEYSAGLAITEIYRITGTPEDVNRYFLGCQDNGTMRRDAATSVFDVANGSDGTTCTIDYSNWDIVYAGVQNGGFLKSTDAGDNGTFVDLSIPGGDGAWVSPMIMDQTNHLRLFVGKTDVFRSDNGGDSWLDMNAPVSFLFMNCLAQGTSNPNRLYVSSEAALARSDNATSGSPTWVIISDPLPDLFISGIAVDPDNSAHVFVSVSGYLNGAKVYRSYDAGSTWIDLSGSLPNVPTNCIRFHDNGLANDALYVGTDVGVFYRDNDLDDWIFFSNGMPATNVSDLYINTANSTITAGTYGRGLWRSSLYTGCVTDLTFNSSSANSGVRFYSVSNTITSSTNYRNDLGTEIHYSAGSSITLITDFEAGGYSFFHGTIGACPDITTEPLNSPLSPTSILVMNGMNKKADD